MTKSIQDYRAVIFDVDGTLYFQRKLRLIMAVQLMLYYVVRPNRISELKIIRTFRKLREEDHFGQGDVDRLQYQLVADRLGIPVEEVKPVIEKWIYRAPLPYLRRCRDESLAALVRQIRERGILAIAYSDYPAVEKLAALDLQVDHVFCATDPMIDCLKPNAKGIDHILQSLPLSAGDCLFIGDRDEKDGECARRRRMDYVILGPTQGDRAKAYQDFSFHVKPEESRGL